MRAASTDWIGPSARATMLASRTTIVSSSPMRLRSGAIWSNGRTSAYHLSDAAFSRHVLDGFLQLVALEPLAPEVEDEHLGQELLVLAPAAIALADGDEDFHQQRLVQVVHQGDELLAGVAQQVGVVAGDQFAAGDVQVAALAEQLAELRGEIGEFEGRDGHGWYYRGPRRATRKLGLWGGTHAHADVGMARLTAKKYNRRFAANRSPRARLRTSTEVP